MNAYQKTLLTLGLSLMTVQAYGLTAGEIKTFIANDVTQPFQKLTVNNLFAQKVPVTFFNNLATTATMVKEFIQTTGKSDSDLMKAFQHTQNATNLLINGIKECYQKLNVQEFQAANSILSDFITLETNMKTIILTIDKITFYLPGKKEARDILATFAELLSFISNKAQKDIVSKFPTPY